ncbi:hypothetical protein EDC96DRAFT_131368 [Choanephora cucurbitarum]|nr:hypothetical protein EDC96DRAFT_131368 [Choanephora cucurbitarum]
MCSAYCPSLTGSQLALDDHQLLPLMPIAVTILILDFMCSRLLYEISPYRCRRLPFASLLLFYRFSWLPIYLSLVNLYFSLYSILGNPELPIGS